MELLTGERFTVASYGVAAAYAGWLLREFGAEVDHECALDPDGLGAFLGQGASFVSEPRLTTDPGVTLITDAPPTEVNEARLRRIAESAPVVWITPWGLSNGWRHRPATDLVLCAAGGWMSAVGEPGREPLAPPGAQCQFVGGLFATNAALAHHAVEGANARPGLTEVSLVEAVTATMIYDAVTFQYHDRIRERAGNRFAATQPTLATLPCKDGYIAIHAALHRQWLELTRLIGHPELATDPRFAAPLARCENVADLDSYLLPWLAERTRFEVYHFLQAARIPGSAHPRIDEVLDSPHLAARGSWHEVNTPSGTPLRVPGPVARVLDEVQGGTDTRADGPWEPGALRVMDLSMGWAGPLLSYVLAALGADVIKVESHTHFDWWRGSRPPGDDPSLALHERSSVFNTTNRGKRGLTLNLNTTRGRELALALVDGADVLIENFGAGILERLGLTWETLKERNPGLVMIRQPGFGSTGPEAGYVAFGNTIEGMSGLTSLIGYPGEQPMMMSNALGDPVSGLTAAATTLAAMAARRRDGRGRLVECAQLEGFLPFTAEAAIEYQRTGVAPGPSGNNRPASAFAAVVDCGEDSWLAVEARTEGQRAALEGVVGPGPGDARARLEEFAKGTGRDAAADALAAAGVAAAPVHNEADVLTAEPFQAADFWFGEEREYVGFHLYPSLPAITAGERRQTRRPAPTLGEHNAEILTGLGVPVSEMLALTEAGVIGTVPAG